MPNTLRKHLGGVWHNRKIAAWVLPAALIVLLFTVRSILRHPLVEIVQDFAPVFGGASCLTEHCNPYRQSDLERQILISGGDLQDLPSRHQEVPVYPPSTFAVVLPFTAFPYHLASILWVLFGALTISFAAIVVTLMCLQSNVALASIMVCTILISNGGVYAAGNPGTLATGLALIAIWLIQTRNSRRQRLLAALLLGVGTALKFTVAGPLFLWLLLDSKSRRPALVGIGLSLLLLLMPAIWLSHHAVSASWAMDLSKNLALASSPGGTNDPTPEGTDAGGFTNLQTVFAVLNPYPAFYDRLTWFTCAAIGAVWILGVLRWKQDRRKLSGPALGCLACLILLVTYHRIYDARILLVTVPALAALSADNRLLTFTACLLTTVGACPFVLSLAERLKHIGHFWQSSSSIGALLLTRCAPLALLVLAIVYLWLLFQQRGGARSMPLVLHQRSGQ
jgi:hypothetical protein